MAFGVQPRRAAAAIAAAAAFSWHAAAADVPPRHRPADGDSTDGTAGTSSQPVATPTRRARPSPPSIPATRAHYPRLALLGAPSRPAMAGSARPIRIDLAAADSRSSARVRRCPPAAGSPSDRRSAGSRGAPDARNIGLLAGDFERARSDCRLVIADRRTAAGTVCLASALTGTGLARSRAAHDRGTGPGTDNDAPRTRALATADRSGPGAASRRLRGGARTARAGVRARSRHEEARTRLAEGCCSSGATWRARLQLAQAPDPSLARLVLRLRAAKALGDARGGGFEPEANSLGCSTTAAARRLPPRPARGSAVCAVRRWRAKRSLSSRSATSRQKILRTAPPGGVGAGRKQQPAISQPDLADPAGRGSCVDASLARRARKRSCARWRCSERLRTGRRRRRAREAARR